MSRSETIGGTNYTPSPCKEFLKVKNNYIKKILKGEDGEDDTEVLVFKNMEFEYQDKDNDYENVSVPLPYEFAILNPNLTTFKGTKWEGNVGTNYFSNEVENKEDLISIRTKEGEVMSFTLKQLEAKNAGTKTPTPEAAQIKEKLKGLGITRYNSIYVATKQEDGTFKIQNLQLKGQTLSGIQSKKPNPATGKLDTLYEGFWNFKSKNARNLVSHYVLVKDCYVAKMDSGTKYGVPNFTLGSEISKKDSDQIDHLYDILKEYHTEYFKKGSKSVINEESEIEPEVNDELPWDRE